METLIAIAASTYRARLEDSCDAAAMTQSAVLVADGVGTLPHCGEAAHFVVSEGACQLQKRHNIGQLPQLFPTLQTALSQHAAPVCATESLKTSASFATTLLLATNTADALGIAYVGNGAIFHLPGDFTSFGAGMALPWTFANLLRPHCTANISGKAALTRHFDATGDPSAVEPTTLWVRKDNTVGDILVLCTDGIFSSDQVLCGNPGDGTRWQEVPHTLIRLHETLRAAFCSPEPLTQERLQAALQKMLDDLRTQGELDDDATIGLLVTEAAIHYHESQGVKA